jgi:hypothetical protein
MSLNDHQALYLAHLLSCRGPTTSFSKLTLAIHRKQQQKDVAWRAYDQASIGIYGRIDALAESIMARMQAQCQEDVIFSLNWRAL